MKYPVIFSSVAGKEAIDQAIGLEDRRVGYGRKFQAALQAVIRQLSEHPTRYATTTARPDLRCVRMPKPFHRSHSVYYRFDGQIVRILCVFPNRRSESIWQERE